MATSRLLRYAAHGTEVSVSVDEPAVLDAVRSVFRAYERDGVAPHRPGRTVRIRSHPGGYLLETSSDTVRCERVLDLVGAFEYTLTTMFLAGCADVIQLHAGGAVVNGGGVLALGRPGAGKSSLAVCWHHAGSSALGDDVVLIENGPQALPFKRLFEVDPVVLRSLGIDPAGTVLWHPGSREAWYDPEAGAGWSEGAPVSTIAMVSFAAGSPLLVDPVNRSTLLNALLHSTIATGASPGAGFETLADIAERAAGYRVTFGSAPEAAQAIADLAP